MSGLFVLLGCASVFVLDILVIWNILKSPFNQTAKVLLVLMVLLLPVWGVVAYHLIRPMLLKKSREMKK